MAKSATFGIMHVGIAFSVGYALTGSLAIAGALTVVEPLCNTVAHYFFDRWWEGRARRRAAAAQAQTEPGAVAFSSRVSQASA
jgi:uncharacterized membrane protein